MKANSETDILKNILKKAQDDLSVLLDEKRTLMDTVRSLQVGCQVWCQQISNFIAKLNFRQIQLVSTEKTLKTDGNR